MRSCLFACLVLIIIGIARADDFSWKLTAGNGDWNDETKWDPDTGACAPSCYPGATTRNDAALLDVNAVTLTLSTGPISMTPTLDINCLSKTCEAILGLDGVALGDTTISNGKLSITESASVGVLTIGDALDISSGKTLTSGAVTINSGTITGTGILDAGSNEILLNTDYTLTSTWKGKVTLNSGDLTMSSGKIEGSKITVRTGTQFNYNGGDINSVTDIEIFGTVNIANSISSSGSFVADGSSVVSFDASVSALDISYDLIDISTPLVLKCGNGISLSSVQTPSYSGLTVKTESPIDPSCVVDMVLDTTSTLTIDDAILSITSIGTVTALGTTTVANGGKLETNGQQLNVGGTLLFSESGVLSSQSGLPVKISQISTGSNIQFNSNQEFLLEYSPNPTFDGGISVNNAQTKITFSSATETMVNSVAWSFNDCTLITVNQDFNINAALGVKCSTDFNRVTNIGSGLTIESLIEVPVGATFQTTSSGSVTLTSGADVRFYGTVDIGTLSMTNGIMTITGSSTLSDTAETQSVVSSTINLNGGTLDVSSIGTFQLLSTSLLDWTEGSLVVGGTKTISVLSGSSFVVSAADKTFNGKISLDEGTLDLRSTVAFGTGGISSTGSSNFIVSADQTFGTDYGITLESGFTLFQSAAIQFNGISSASSGTWTISGVDSDITIGNTFTGSALSVTNPSSDLIITAAGHLSLQRDSTTGSSWSQTAATLLDGRLTASGIDTSFSTGSVTFNNSPTIIATNGGSVTLDSPTFTSSALFQSSVGGIIHIDCNTGSAIGTYEASIGRIRFDNCDLGVAAGDQLSIDLVGNSRMIIRGTVTPKNFVITANGDASILIQNTGNFVWESGNLDLSTFGITGIGDLTINGGTVSLSGKSISLAGGSLIDTVGGLSVEGDSVLSITGGSFSVASNLTFSDTTEVYLGGSSISSPFMAFEDNSKLILDSGTTTLSAPFLFLGGTFSFTSSVVSIENVFSVGFTTATVENAATLNIENGADVDLGNAILRVDTSTLQINGGHVNVTGGSRIIIENSAVLVDVGSIEFQDGSFLEFKSQSTADLVGNDSPGRLVMLPGSTLKVSGSPTVKKTDPVFDFREGAIFSSTATDSGTFGAGVTYFEKPCQPHFNESVEYAENSTVTVSQEGCIEYTLSDVSFTDSLLSILDNGYVSLDNSILDISAGDSEVSMSGNSHMSLDNSSTAKLYSPFILAVSTTTKNHLDLSNNSEFNVYDTFTMQGTSIARLVSNSKLLISGEAFFGINTRLDLTDSRFELKKSLERFCFTFPGIPAFPPFFPGIPGFSFCFTFPDTLLTVRGTWNAENSEISVADRLELQSGVLNFGSSTVTSSSKGKVIMTLSATFTAHTNTTVTVGDLLNISGGSAMELQSGSSFALPSTGRIELSSGSISLDEWSKILVDGPLLMNSGSSVTATDASTFELVSASGFVTINGGASILVRDPQSKMTLRNGIVSAFDDSSISIQNSGALLLRTGNIFLNDVSTLNINGGSVDIEANGVLEGRESSFIYLTSSSTVLVTGQVNLRGNSKLSVLSDSSFSIDGDVLAADNAEVTVNSASFSILQDFGLAGSMRFIVNSKLFNNDGDISVFGSLLIENDSLVSATGGNFFLEDGELLISDIANLELKTGSQITIDGGELNSKDTATIQCLGGSSIEILNEDMNIFGNSTFTLSGGSSVTVSGGSAFFYGNSTSSVQGIGTQVDVKSGTTVCRDTAKITFQSGGKYNVSSSVGSAEFTDNCTLTGESQGKFFSSGNTIFQDFAAIDMTISEFTVVDGDCSFRNSSTGSLASGSKFTVENGNAFLEDSTVITLVGSSVFNVESGSVTQSSESFIGLSASFLTVDSDFFQFDDSRVLLITGSSLLVGGSFESRNSTTVTSIGSAIGLEAGGSVGLFDSSSWVDIGNQLTVGAGGEFVMHDSSSLLSTQLNNAFFNGNVTLLNNANATAINKTKYIIQNGNFDAHDFAKVNIQDQSSLEVTDGSVSFSDNSLLFIDASSKLIVTSGNVVFQDLSNFETEIETEITVNGGSLTFQGSLCLDFHQILLSIIGNLNMKLNSCLTFTSSVISISNGNLLAVDNYDLTFSSTPITINQGGATFGGSETSLLSLTNLEFQILAGNAIFNDFSSPDFNQVNFTLQNGGARFSGNSASVWRDSIVRVSDLNNSPFVSFEEFAVTVFIDSSLTVTRGSVSLIDSVNSTWTRSDVILQGANLNFIGSGIHLFEDSFVSVNGINAEANFGGSFFAIFNNTDFLVDTSTAEVTFYGSIQMRFNSMEFSINGGIVSLFGAADLNFNDSNFTISDGELISTENVQMDMKNTPFTILAASAGEMAVSGSSYFKFESSPMFINSGSVAFSGNSTLQFLDPSTSLTISFGNFVFRDFSDFLTVQGTHVNISSGQFQLLGNVDISFDQVTTSVSSISGEFLLTDFAQLSALDSSFDIVGLFNVRSNGKFTTTGSIVELTGNLATQNTSSFISFSSELNIRGNVEFRGNINSNHYLEDSDVTIYDNGDFLMFEEIVAEFVDSRVILLGGFVRGFNSAATIISGGSMELEGTGTLEMKDNSRFEITDRGVVTVVTSGATATFSDFATVDVYSAATMNITAGSVSFFDSSKFSLREGTFFNLIDGSLVLHDSSNMVAYPYTQGTIHGGNLHIRDSACLTFIQSEISIIGSIDNNSTCVVQFLSGTNITVTGTVELAGEGVIQLTNGTFLHVQDGSIILRDFAEIRSDEGVILVSGGSILGYDFSRIWADNSTETTVEGGNITIADSSSLLVSGGSSVLVTATPTTQGSVYSQGYSIVQVIEDSALEVNLGNLEVSEHSTMQNSDSLIRVISGNLDFIDFARFQALSGAEIEVLANGNITASGIGVSLDFFESSTRVVGGDLVLGIRSTMISKQSLFEISAAGNVIFTDITRTIMQQNSVLNIFGGGNLELFRNAYFTLKSSLATVGNGGSALFGEDVVFDLLDSSSLRVDGGDIIFYGAMTKSFILISLNLKLVLETF